MTGIKKLTLGVSVALCAGLLSAGPARAESDKKTERTWKAKCASCHGAEGKGDTDQGAKLKVEDYTKAAWQASKTDDQIKTAIETGVVDKMDPYKDKVDAEQIVKLVAHIRSFKK